MSNSNSISLLSLTPKGRYWSSYDKGLIKRKITNELKTKEITIHTN